MISRGIGVGLGGGVRAGQPGVPGSRVMMRLGSAMPSLARMARWVGLVSVRWRKVPAGAGEGGGAAPYKKWRRRRGG